MWIRTSLVLLSTFVVIGLSFPHPDDAAYQIPEVGTGQRSQYYVLHADGTFKYGFDSGDGAYEAVKSESLGNRVGRFGYVDPEGETIRLEYEAGEGGFVARGDHLPKPSPELAQALAAVVRSSAPFVDPLASSDADASYGFEFQSDDHSRNEQSDADGTVTGSYSYVDEDGVTRSFTYRAGEGIGFVIEGDGITQDVAAPTRTAVRQQPSIRRPQAPSRQSAAGYGTSTIGATPNQANVAYTRSQAPGDASYSFSYDAGSHSRSESSDPDLNVDGTFSFVADDGVTRRVDYNAGASTGFQAQGDHLPKAPTLDRNVFRSSSSSRAQNQRRQSSRKPSWSAATGFAKPSSQQTTTTVQSQRTGTTTGVQRGNIASTRSGDASYSFSYDADDHSRSEASDANLNIDGTFSFVADDGVSRTVDYVAGSSTGFQAQGDHLPRAPVADVSHLRSTTSRTRKTNGQRSRQPSWKPSAGITTGQSHRTAPATYGSTSPARRTSTPIRSRPFEEANVRSTFSPSGSYSFSYDTSSHSRAESGDDDNNVVGNFAFVADDDGQRREVTYEAGALTGFIAEGDHIPVGPIVPGSPSGQPTGRIVPVSSEPFVDPLASSDADASYNFEFDSDTYSRSETADEDGNVVGSYTIVDDDGTRRTYNFRAGEGIGFETEEVSRSAGPPPVRRVPTQSTGPAPVRRVPAHPSTTQTRSRQTQGASRTSTPSRPQQQRVQPSPSVGRSYLPPSQPSRQPHPSSQPARPVPSRSPLPSRRTNDFADFTLNRYDASPDAEKFGYVLRFN